MIALQILDQKLFMSSLLVHNTFDRFLLSELDIDTAVHYHISGIINRDWFDADELEQMDGRSYMKWEDIKPTAYELIKGKKTPLSFKIVFMLDEKDKEGVARSCGPNYKKDDIGAMFMNLRFEKETLTVITGASMKVFSMDQTMEKQWDETVKRFIAQNKIAFEQI